jgi:hypothetical protein
MASVVFEVEIHHTGVVSDIGVVSRVEGFRC